MRCYISDNITFSDSFIYNIYAVILFLQTFSVEVDRMVIFLVFQPIFKDPPAPETLGQRSLPVSTFSNSQTNQADSWLLKTEIEPEITNWLAISTILLPSPQTIKDVANLLRIKIMVNSNFLKQFILNVIKVSQHNYMNQKLYLCLYARYCLQKV